MSRNGHSTKSPRIRALNDLKLDPHNANKGTDRGRAMVGDSLMKFGAGRSVLAACDGKLLAGNKTVEQAIRSGAIKRIRPVHTRGDELVVVVRDDLKSDSQKARGLALADNRAAQVGLEWDLGILDDIAKNEPELLADLWDDKELDDLLSPLREQATEEKVDPNALLARANELQKKWKLQRGDRWEIPSRSATGVYHRIMCGDSHAEHDVECLLAGTQAALGLTSPPYWVGKDFETQKSVHEIDDFIRRSCVTLSKAVRRDASRIVINTGTGFSTSFDKRKKRQLLLHIDKWANYLFEQGWNLRHIRHWLKSARADHPLAASVDLIDQHSEFLETFEHDRGKPIDFDDILPEDEVELLGVWYNADGANRGQEHIGKAATKWIFKSYWDDIQGVARQFGHPASFPVELVRRHALLYTKPREIVIDIFLGAATTIIACEMLGRTGYGMELDPKYCAVALERASEFGLEPRRVKSWMKAKSN